MVFTRDLRVRDNPALAAAARADQVVPLFVFDDALLGGLHGGANRLRFLIQSLADLHAALERAGAGLIIRRGNWPEEVATLAHACGADAVHLSDDVSAFAAARVDALSALGAERGFAVVTHSGVTVVPPGDLLTGAHTTYQVFTPFFRRWRAAPWRSPVRAPATLTLPPATEPGVRATLEMLPDATPSPAVIEGGETAALARLKAWAAHGLAGYATGHDAIADDATSHASAALHFGCLSPLEVATRLRGRPGGDAFTRQLCWRDFFHHLLAAQPEIAWQDLRPRGTPTGRDDAAFTAWCAGRTGYPLVDAGMRQLRREGFVHNRVRMVVASFLTKDLDMPWQRGARHFMDLLVDGDVANNQLNWQWVAGTGTDSNPRRILSPLRQSERFDPDGVYIRRYVAELATADNVHDPTDEERARLGYPVPLVDH